MQLSVLLPIVLLCAVPAPVAAQFSTASAAWVRTPQTGPGNWTLTNYSYDDGSSENALGLIAGGMMCWLQRFDAVNGTDTIHSISVAYGHTGGAAPPDGTPATLAIWEDPNDDGNPTDGSLLVTQATTVVDASTNIFTAVSVSPTEVTGVFFVGVYLQHAAGQYPAPMDTGQPSLGRAWATGSNNPSLWDPTNLADPNHIGMYELDLIGYPSVFLLRADGYGNSFSLYCTAKVNSLGCTPYMGAIGYPSAALPGGFAVTCKDVRNNKAGTLYYGFSGRAAIPFQGGTLCVQPPIKRTTSVPSSGGSPLPAQDCTGVYSIDMNAFAQGLTGGLPVLALQTPGTVVNCQWWGRDQGFPPPNNTTLSDALEYTVGP